MKKSTGIFILITFFFMMIIIAGVIITILVMTMQGTSPNFFSTNQVALVRVEGLIYDAEEWIDQIETYAEDDSIPAIVVRVDSPGGAVGPSQDLYDAIYDARYKSGKVVVASFGSLAASGGYYLAAAANEIMCSEGTLTGSIGVYAKFFEAEGLFDKLGIDYETVKAGEFKDMGSMERGLHPKEREMMQYVIDDTYEQFIEVVKQGRQDDFIRLLNTWEPDDSKEYYPFTPKLRSLCRENQQKKKEHEEKQEELRQKAEAEKEAEDVLASATGTAEATNIESATAENSSDEGDENEIDFDESSFEPAPYIPNNEIVMAFARETAEGKIYTGRQAREIGLVDRFGTLDEAIDRAAELANLKGEITVVERKQREMTLFDMLTQKLSLVTGESKNYSPLEYKFQY